MSRGMPSTPTAPKGAATGAAPARAARAEARRAQILAAATDLMQESGYHAMSMQDLAERAGISVGLAYQYFGGKEDLLRAVVVDILEDFRAQVPAAIAVAGGDPVARVTAGIAAFCAVIDTKRAGARLAYRESQTLPPEGRALLQRLEQETNEPLREAILDGIEAGVFRPVDPELVVHDVVMIAHGWALKHWHLGQRMSLADYVAGQTDLVLAAIMAPAGPAAFRSAESTSPTGPSAR